MTAATALLLLVATAAPVDVTFTVPAGLPAQVQVVRLARVAAPAPWQVADVRNVEVRSGRFLLPGPPGLETLVVVRAAGHPGYLLHGPMGWPSQPASFEINPEWRRTVRGRYPASGDLEWVSPRDGPRVLCEWTLPERWECLGVPMSVAGIVVRGGAGTGALFYSIVGSLGPRNDVEDVQTASAAWGRLVVVENLEEVSGQPPGDRTVRASAVRLHRPPARPRAMRLEVEIDPRVRADAVGAAAIWITGRPDVTDTWIDLAVRGTGAARIGAAELAAGPPALIFPVALQRPMAVFGRVTGPLAEPVPEAIVSLYRFGSEMRSADTRKIRRERIAAGERRTDDDGMFSFPDLVPERYELLTVHPSYGRAVTLVEPHAGEVQVALKPPPVVEGRVVRDGSPQARVPVVFVPDLAEFAAAEDPTEVQGGETQTDADGLFRLFAAVAGQGELKIGAAPGAVRRVPLPAAGALPPVTRLGDIDLGSGPMVTIVFEEAGECEPILTGPIGRTGLTVVRTKRLGPAMFTADLPEPGRWNVVAICGRREQGVVPSAVDVEAGRQEATLVLRWP